ncbi:outer membrane protein [Bartonella bacilliformis]|uniref:outer membrane protein n=1 Tax=Bartonella bacilliformis TaxID=774 RepID=UPI0007AF0B62|nr:outer membrane protein [Bartonella bacilliformis]KZN22406.1 hemin-binding protein E [Bartonella bacilliformis]QFZ90763.1 outer membrane beta-barrel protein [Bartonella bacilliformis]
MNIKCLVTASVCALISASAAQAADVMIPQEISPIISAPTFSWTGLYLGGQIGGLSGKHDFKAIGKDSEWPFANKDLKVSGFVGGLYAGSNIDLGSGLVLGVDTDIVWVDKEGKLSSNHKAETQDDADAFKQIFDENKIEVAKGQIKELTQNFSLKEKWAGATRVRIGFGADRIMPYVSGGVAYTQVQAIGSAILKGTKDTGTEGGGGSASKAVRSEALDVLASGTITDEKKTLLGYTLGAGVDFAMTDNVILRTEYRYSDFGKKKFVKDAIETNYKTNDFRVGVAYKF